MKSKTTKSTSKTKSSSPKVEISAKAAQKPQKEFSELVVKEIMVQKQCSREEALKILETHK